MKGTVVIDRERCKGCLYCADVCPRSVFALSEHKNSRGYPFMAAVRGEDCIGCRQCTVICPDAAISLYEEETV